MTTGVRRSATFWTDLRGPPEVSEETAQEADRPGPGPGSGGHLVDRGPPVFHPSSSCVKETFVHKRTEGLLSAASAPLSTLCTSCFRLS